MNKKEISVLLIAFLITFSIGILGSFFTDADSGWYESVKPMITPPGWVFPIVWNILYILIAISIYYVWLYSENKNVVILAFGTNLVLNVLWSYLYFGLHRPDFSFVCLAGIWLTTFWMILIAYRVSNIATFCLVPYFAWISFAGVLNWMSVKNWFV